MGGKGKRGNGYVANGGQKGQKKCAQRTRFARYKRGDYTIV